MTKKTTSTGRMCKDGVVTWNNHEGTKASHEVNVTQMNSKNVNTGDHTFYNQKSGVMGVAGGNRDSKKK